MTKGHSAANLPWLEYLSHDKALLQLTIDALPVPVFYKDANGVYLRCNKAFESFIQIKQADLVGRNAYQLFEKELAEAYHNADIELISNPGIQVYEKQIRNYQGNEVFVRFHKTSLSDEAGNITGLVGVIFDITEQKDLEEKLRLKVDHDDLTGLFNRAKGYQIAESLLIRAREEQTKFGMLMIDIDDFKNVNDTWGHLVGDKALRHIAQLFKHCQSDTESIIRWGGEEFLVLIEDTHASEPEFTAILRSTAERYRETIEQTPLLVNEDKITITISGGGCHYQGQSLIKMISDSDKRLYKAKSLGKNQTCF
ncbi:GGDEF domain-containing protein [uncultured Vibrio sp.]|uniref:GGDEF domain-containing protein n=1 Tax=uncultured Vibrio sp. TaxID=114054 RepID=UPI0025F2C110|nr:diguanylate cyclase [uncultured Vibrio sp.]